jgi:hypothetical protein
MSSPAMVGAIDNLLHVDDDRSFLKLMKRRCTDARISTLLVAYLIGPI